MNEHPTALGSLYFLWHPGTETIFSGCGLTLQPGHKGRLVGLLLVDRPQPVDPAWLAAVEVTFGGYELYVMTAQHERGIACQMWIEAPSLVYVRPFDMPLTTVLRQTLIPLHQQLPRPRFKVRWDEMLRLWVSEFHQ